MIFVGSHFRALKAIKITSPLINMFCKMYYSTNDAKNDTFRIFYAKLYILPSVDGSTNRRNEIIFGGHYNNQIW